MWSICPALCVFGCATPNFNKTSLALWSNFHSRHLAYINNLYDNELGHK